MPETTATGNGREWLRPQLVAVWWEVVLVMALTTGVFLLSAIRSYLHGSSTQYMTLILTDRRLLNMIAFEGSVVGLMLLYLRRRGWTPADFRIRFTLRGTLLGFVLPVPAWGANMVAIGTLFMLAFALGGYAGLMQIIADNKPVLIPHSVQVAWASIIVACIVNAYLEEITCTAYFFNQLAARIGPFAALLATDMLRMSFHVYQGALHMLGIGAVFLVLNGCYWWTRNLWTLILAHILIDVFNMGVVKELLS